MISTADDSFLSAIQAEHSESQVGPWLPALAVIIGQVRSDLHGDLVARTIQIQISLGVASKYRNLDQGTMRVIGVAYSQYYT